MASYVDSSFRQAIMKNPNERTQQVRSLLMKKTLDLFVCLVSLYINIAGWNEKEVCGVRKRLFCKYPQLAKLIFFFKQA